MRRPIANSVWETGKRMNWAIFFSLPLLIAACIVSAQPAPFSITLPVKCDVGSSCLVQKLVDHDPGPGRQDYRCGLLTTDGHDGVDIRLRTMADMQSGYAVIAAAAGQVLRTRDGEPDISARGRTDLEGKDAGNAVVIDHGNGWQTQYSHLRQRSVSVRPGQQVASGEKLGLIGMSGNAEFPHLHFTVRYEGKAVDPFIDAEPVVQCEAKAQITGIWTPLAARALSYTPTAVITAGLASNVPPKSVAERATPPVLAARQSPILMWVDMIGAQAGDMQQFAITGPDGQPVHVQETIVDGGGLSWFTYSGKRAPATGWSAGRYVGRYTLRRRGVIVAETDTSAVLR